MKIKYNITVDTTISDIAYVLERDVYRKRAQEEIGIEMFYDMICMALRMTKNHEEPISINLEGMEVEIT